jgi:hypothetical protein
MMHPFRRFRTAEQQLRFYSQTPIGPVDQYRGISSKPIVYRTYCITVVLSQSTRAQAEGGVSQSFCCLLRVAYYVCCYSPDHGDGWRLKSDHENEEIAPSS